MVKSPCINICEIDLISGFCVGCNRTEQEITNWIYYNNKEKEKIVEIANSRLELKKTNIK
jgi:predicted Fe-S protein YdhL (DUF1289 family)|tara:strand:- start:506 stop:685 length:180 start_codon:yes stop_codon:yes gene_type:complete